MVDAGASVSTVRLAHAARRSSSLMWLTRFAQGLLARSASGSNLYFSVVMPGRGSAGRSAGSIGFRTTASSSSGSVSRTMIRYVVAGDVARSSSSESRSLLSFSLRPSWENVSFESWRSVVVCLICKRTRVASV